MPEQMTLDDLIGGDATGMEAKYQAFVDKFKPKKTTDDCYTPDNIYRAVAGWVAEEYGLNEGTFVRPFWPGEDYELALYPEGCVVVDNPPFSIISRICAFYLEHGIRYFLFAPTLTLFSGALDQAHIACGVQITYDNGARVNTSFVTNLDGCRVRSAPELYRRVRLENDRNEKTLTKDLPKYSYPAELLTAAAAYQYSHYGIAFSVGRDECRFVRALDSQRAAGKAVFGGGFLLGERAAAERAAAERAAAERAAAERAAAERAAAERAAAERAAKTAWTLSPRERAIVERLGKGDRDEQ